MALYGNNPTATATVGANTNVVTITGVDLSVVAPGMTINLGARDRKTGDSWVLASVAPNGSNGGTVTTQGSIPTAYNSVPFIIDTTGYLGTDASYAAAVGVAILDALRTLFGVATNLYSGARQLVLDKAAATSVSRIAYSIAGRAWGAIEHRTFTYTPTGGQTTSIETLGVRTYADGTTPIDALLFDLATGTGDLRKAQAVMSAATTVDLGSAPAGKVAILGSATISSLGPGRNLERLVHIVDGGGTLKHDAARLILPGRADIVTRAGDWFHATSDAGGTWRVGSYQRADGTALISNAVRNGTGPGQVTTSAIAIGLAAGGVIKVSADVTDFGEIFTTGNNAAGSTGAAASLAYFTQRLPSGALLQGGSSILSLDANGRGTVMLFTPSTVNVSAEATNGDYGVTNATPSVSNLATDRFSVSFPGSANGTVRVNWSAIGRWK